MVYPFLSNQNGGTWFQSYPCLNVCAAQMFQCHKLQKILCSDLHLCGVATEKHLKVIPS